MGPTKFSGQVVVEHSTSNPWYLLFLKKYFLLLQKPNITKIFLKENVKTLFKMFIRHYNKTTELQPLEYCNFTSL
jgi:hypothetical protein